MVAEGIIWMNDHNDDDPQAILSSLAALVFVKSKVGGGGACWVVLRFVFNRRI